MVGRNCAILQYVVLAEVGDKPDGWAGDVFL